MILAATSWGWVVPLMGMLGLVSTVAAAVAIAKSTLAQATITLYRDDNAALRLRIDTMEQERSDLASSVAELKATVASLQVDNVRLTDLATGASAVKELAQLVTERHVEVMGAFKEITALLTIALKGTS